MKLRRWLAVMMSVMLVGASFPVYASEETEEEMTEAVLTLEEEESGESDIEPDLNEETVESLEADTNEERITSVSFETQEKADIETEIETNDETQTEEMEDIETEAVEQTEESTVIGAADDIASGKQNNITWVIDKDGKLTVTGTGDLRVSGSGALIINRAPWYDNRESILSAEVTLEGIKDISCLFYECKNLVSVDLSKLDTSNVLYMSGMFGECSSLESADLSSFDTTNVTTMGSMFAGCGSLINVNISGFKTANVTDITGMFRDCSSLASVDINGFDTGNVVYMWNLFKGCSSLTSIDVSSLDTKNAVYMKSMFEGCGNLTSLDLSSFDTRNVTDMRDMFSGCGNLTNLDLSKFNTQSVTDMSKMFAGCNSLTSLDLSGFNTGNVTKTSCMFERCSGLTNLDMGSFDFSNVIDVLDMFLECSQLTSIQSPKNITVEIGLPAKSGYAWYYNDAEITSLPQNLSYSAEIQSRKNGTDSDDIASGTYENITWVIDKDGKLTVTGTGEFSSGDGAPWYDYNDSILSAEVAITDITDLSGMFRDCKNVISIDVSRLDTSQVTNMMFMFDGCQSLTNIDLSGFNTSQVTDMSAMFAGCQNLTNLDLSDFNTSHVTDMRFMFNGCQSLTSIDLSGFNTSRVTDMGVMFEECYNLESINLSGFDTSQVTEMCNMFSFCQNLTSIDLSGFDTKKVTDMSLMFSFCQNLTSINLSGFDTKKVTDMSQMFFGCSGLTSLNLGNFDLENVTDSYEMFMGCISLTTVQTPKNVTVEIPLPESEGYSWYYNETKITSLPQNLDYSVEIKKIEETPEPDDIASGSYGNITWIIDANGKLTITGNGEFSGETGTERAPWYSNKDSILSAEASVESITNLSYMFYGCKNLISVNLSGLNTGSAIDMEGMFKDCSSLINVNLSSFDTKNVTNMWGMFEGCSSLSSVDVSGFHTENVTDMQRMFEGCSSLANVDVSNFDTGKVTTMWGMFEGCNSLTSIDISDFHTGNVVDMAAMFYGCSCLTTINMNGLDTRNVKYMNYMFFNCSNLTNVNMNGFHTENVTNIGGMFEGCSCLTNLDLSSFDFSQVGGDSQNVFSGCEQLAVIQTPKNIVVEISLPGNGWYYGETEITSLPQKIGYSVEVKKKTGTEPEKPDNPVAPEITTTEIPRAVQNVPYETVIQNNGLTAVSWQISAGKLPEGIDLGMDGVIYGVTKSTGKFKFTVTMMVNDTQATAEKTYTLIIQKSTDNAVDSVADPGYEIIQPIPNINIKNGITDQLFICNGSYAEFRNTYIDGDKLVRDVDYTAESGSTRITIKAETLGKLGTGKHTLGVEFRTSDGFLKRAAQNFKITNGSTKGGKGNSDNSNQDSSIQETPAWTDDMSDMDEFILWEEPHPDQVDENGYYPVEMAFVSEKNAVMSSNQLRKYYGNTVYLLAHLGNGIGYSITATDINPEQTTLNLSAELEPLDDFADGFATLQVKMLNEALLPYRIGLHVNVGTQYSGKVAYLFLFDKSKGAYVSIGAMTVSENGNVMTPVDEIADIIIMIEQ